MPDGTEEAGRRYHHGDLRRSLLEAAEAELAENGVEGFTLRGCAKRAGVSHAAPAHHFGDVNGLLTALAGVGFRRFLTAQQARQDRAGADPKDRHAAAGLAYVEFALAYPELFRLMFSSRRADFSDAELGEAAGAAFDNLAGNVARINGTDPRADEAGMRDVMASWAMVHGLATLLLDRHLKPLTAMPPAEREAVMSEIIRRAFDGRGAGPAG